jgi:hypothetical protein
MSKPIEVALSAVAAATLSIGLAAAWPHVTQARDIIEEWDFNKAPPLPTDNVKRTDLLKF